MSDQPKPTTWVPAHMDLNDEGFYAHETNRLTTELEHERICHATCGVIAMSNTQDSLAKNRVMKPEYLSASVQDCIRAIERELKLREQLSAEREKIVHLSAAHDVTCRESSTTIQQLREQLAAAQAAIVELRAIANARLCVNCDGGDVMATCTCGNYDKIGDTAALDAAIDKAGIEGVKIGMGALDVAIVEAVAAERKRQDFDWGHVKREYLRLQKENEKLSEAQQTLVDAAGEVDLAYQDFPDVPELNAMIIHGAFNRIGRAISELRSSLAKVKEEKS